MSLQTVGKPLNPCAICIKSHPERFHPAIPNGNNARLHRWSFLRSKNIKRTDLYKANSLLGRADSRVGGPAKLKWSTLPPSTWPASSQGHTLIMMGRACSYFETGALLFRTSPLPDMCFVLPEKNHDLSAAACGLFRDQYFVLFGTTSYSVRHGRMNYTILYSTHHREQVISMHRKQGNS